MSAYRISEQNAVQILEVSNLFNEFDNRQLLNELQKRMDGGAANCVVNLADLNVMNSVGLSFLISLMNRAKKYDGDLILCKPSSKILALLEVTKLKSFFKIVSSVEEGLGVFYPIRAAA